MFEIRILMLVAGLLLSAELGGLIASRRGRPSGDGYLLGLFLGPLGLLIAARLPARATGADRPPKRSRRGRPRGGR